MSSGSRVFRYIRPLLHPYVLYFVVCLAVWLPDGFNIGPVSDAWIKLASPDKYLLTDWVSIRTTELFDLWPYLRLLILATGGFQVCQIVLLVISVLRGVLWFEVVKRLWPGHRWFALASGLVALFHPFDAGYFWLGALGVNLTLLWALALCLVALVHLRTGSRNSLLGIYVLQFMTCFTYTAYLPMVVGVPAGAWLLRRLQGSRAPVTYLLYISLPIVLFAVFQFWVASLGVGREGGVMDPDAGRTLGGYLYAVGQIVPGIMSVFRDSKPIYLVMSFIPAIVAYGLVSAYGADEATVEKSRKWWMVLGVFAAGLLCLALLSYLPYAVSVDRIGVRRQLLAAGIFLSMAFLLLPFVILPRYIPSRYPIAVLLAVVTVITVLSGLEARESFVDVYRNQEALMQAVSTAVPNPPSNSFIEVSVDSRAQARHIQGFYNRAATFTNAMKLLYGDDSLYAGFIRPGGADLQFSQDGVVVKNSGITVPYGKLIVLRYKNDRTGKISEDFVLQSAAQQGVHLPGRVFSDFGSTPGQRSNACSLLEPRFRPVYCQ